MARRPAGAGSPDGPQLLGSIPLPKRSSKKLLFHRTWSTASSSSDASSISSSPSTSSSRRSSLKSMSLDWLKDTLDTNAVVVELIRQLVSSTVTHEQDTGMASPAAPAMGQQRVAQQQSRVDVQAVLIAICKTVGAAVLGWHVNKRTLAEANCQLQQDLKETQDLLAYTSAEQSKVAQELASVREQLNWLQRDTQAREQSWQVLMNSKTAELQAIDEQRQTLQQQLQLERNVHASQLADAQSMVALLQQETSELQKTKALMGSELTSILQQHSAFQQQLQQCTSSLQEELTKVQQERDELLHKLQDADHKSYTEAANTALGPVGQWLSDQATQAARLMDANKSENPNSAQIAQDEVAQLLALHGELALLATKQAEDMQLAHDNTNFFAEECRELHKTAIQERKQLKDTITQLEWQLQQGVSEWQQRATVLEARVKRREQYIEDLKAHHIHSMSVLAAQEEKLHGLHSERHDLQVELQAVKTREAAVQAKYRSLCRLQQAKYNAAHAAVIARFAAKKRQLPQHKAVLKVRIPTGPSPLASSSSSSSSCVAEAKRLADELPKVSMWRSRIPRPPCTTPVPYIFG